MKKQNTLHYDGKSKQKTSYYKTTKSQKLLKKHERYMGDTFI
jgi:hypothetical protein